MYDPLWLEQPGLWRGKFFLPAGYAVGFPPAKIPPAYGKGDGWGV